MIYTAEYDSPLGTMILACDEKAIVGLWFQGQKYFGSGLLQGSQSKETVLLSQGKRWLDIYFSGKEPDFLPSLRYGGTPFQKKVYDILLTIPYGKTMTYGSIAAQMAKETGVSCMSAQAVGGAVGHNPISLLIPCHRVVGTQGNLTGYAGGIERKRKLLEMEHTDRSRFFIPKKSTLLLK